MKITLINYAMQKIKLLYYVLDIYIYKLRIYLKLINFIIHPIRNYTKNM